MLKQLNQAVDYIEDHLLDEKVMEDAIKGTGTSETQFKSVFFFLTGMPLHEYIRNRRLSEANYELTQGEKVTDVAFKYGYQSVDGFSRAFKSWSGFLPSAASREKRCAVFPKFNFFITVKGGDRMKCRLVEMPAFCFAGVSGRVPMQFEGVNQEIVKLAQRITPAQAAEMHRLQDLAPHEIVNVSYHSDTQFLKEEGYLTHLIGVLTTASTVGEGLDTLPMKAGTWVVFPNEGPFPTTLQSTMARIYSEWLMTSDYELADSLSFSFTKMNVPEEGSAYSEIWIPVVRKNKG